MGNPRTALRFLGGAGTVTGSKYLLEYGGRRILIGTGLFQRTVVHRHCQRLAFGPIQQLQQFSFRIEEETTEFYLAWGV